jgi:hypothetical protein
MPSSFASDIQPYSGRVDVEAALAKTDAIGDAVVDEEGAGG